MKGISPFSNASQPMLQTSSQMTNTITNMKGLLKQPGAITAGAPIVVQQNNLAGGKNWALGTATIPTVASSYSVAPFQNGLTCPISTPYLSPTSVCMACPGGFYSLGNQSCVPCSNFNTVTQTCLPPPAPVPPKPVAPNNSVVPPPPPPPPPAPVQYITSTANPTGLILPNNVTLAAFQAKQPVGPNIKPCPPSTPFFDGTICIACGPGQLFDTVIGTCQTCPVHTTYSTTTYHCMPTQYYTNITLNNNWISINRNFTQLQNSMTASAATPYSQPCPLSTPFYNGVSCIACSGSTPYFSFDTNSCQNCGILTNFSSALHSCVIIQQRQTNLNSPNLILGGLSYN